MGAPIPKVLCEVLGKPMLDYVLEAAESVVDDVCVVVGYQSEMVQEHLGDRYTTVKQKDQLGTGHAVMQASDFLLNFPRGNVLILCGDAPFVDKKTLEDSLAFHIKKKNAVTVVSAVLEDPASYGRIVRFKGKLDGIVEFRDCVGTQAKIKEINSGIYWVTSRDILSLLARLDTKNAQKEYYLTDIVRIATKLKLKVDAFKAENPDIVLGANDPEQLAMLNEKAKTYFGTNR